MSMIKIRRVKAKDRNEVLHTLRERGQLFFREGDSYAPVSPIIPKLYLSEYLDRGELFLSTGKASISPARLRMGYLW